MSTKTLVRRRVPFDVAMERIAAANGSVPAAAARVVDEPQTVISLPPTVHLELYQGDDFYLTLQVFTDTGAPFSLAGATPKAQVRHYIADQAPDVLGEFVATSSGNVLSLHLPTAQSTHLTVGVNRWDCQITVAGAVTTLCAGNCTVTGEVTR